MPHNGVEIPEAISKNMTKVATNVVDTDWFMDKLYSFAVDKGCGIINPNFSRYVIDLNRDPDEKELYPGADNTNLCPTSQFDYSSIYFEDGKPSKSEIAHRVDAYWSPYHQCITQELNRLRKKFGMAFLFDAHSIASNVPRFFDGKLTDFNFGTNAEKSCSNYVLSDIQEKVNLEPFSSVYNGRFKGGYITRHYGDPENNIHTLQLELSQSTYLNETSKLWDDAKAAKVVPKLNNLIDTIIQWLEKQ